MHRIDLEILNPHDVGSGQRTASAVEELLAAFERHERQERESLRTYQMCIETHDNSLVKYLLELIAADEEKHHQIITRFVTSLEADLSWISRLKGMPGLGRLDANQRKELVRMTDALIEEEKRGITECKRLARSSAGYYGGLLRLLLDTVVHDSHKHLMILKFLRRRLKEARS